MAKLDQYKEKAVQDISQLWGGLETEQYELLAKHISIKKCKKNEVLYKNQDSPTQVMCLLHGKVKIVKDYVGKKSQMIIRVIKPTEFFGFRAFFAGEIYKTAAMSIEPCIYATLPVGILMKLLEKNFHIGIYFIKYLSVEIGLSDDRTVNLTQKHIRARLAESLIRLKETYGVEEDGYTLSIYLSREELANMSNMTTSNAIRTLSAFASENLIAIDGRKIKLIEEDKLRKISDEG